MAVSNNSKRDFAKMLISMGQEDQRARMALSKLQNRSTQSSIQEKIRRVDKEHAEQLENIIYQIGWPSISLVGKKASSSAWLIAQHSGHNLKFQKYCLRLLQDALKKKDADPKHLAYLTDRILVAENKPQLYGTQYFLNSQNRPILFPMYKPKDLNQRRKSCGLTPHTKKQVHDTAPAD